MDSSLAGSNKMLIKTGQLAKRAGILPSKVRFYVKESILHPVSQTPGGYCLFDGTEAIERLRQIDELQSKQRLTIQEIKLKLGEVEVDDHQEVDAP
jgi:DNA-binding transcriptional MerR regulator